MSYSVEERGSLYSFDYRMFFSNYTSFFLHKHAMDVVAMIPENGKSVISPFHDIPLYPVPSNNTVCNMVVEVPRWSNAKMEVSKGVASR